MRSHVWAAAVVIVVLVAAVRPRRVPSLFQSGSRAALSSFSSFLFHRLPLLEQLVPYNVTTGQRRHARLCRLSCTSASASVKAGEGGGRENAARIVSCWCGVAVAALDCAVVIHVLVLSASLLVLLLLASNNIMGAAAAVGCEARV